MKVKRERMSFLQKILYIISFVFLISAFIYLGTKDFNAPKKNFTDQESFAEEYKISKENLYVYKSSKEVLDLINNGTGILFLGYPENEWSSIIADLLNETAKKNGIKEIYYYNFKKDRSNNNHYYEDIVKILTPYLQIVDTDSTNLHAPTVLFLKNKNIVAYDDETAIVRGNETIETYWTKEKRISKALEYEKYIKEYLGEKS